MENGLVNSLHWPTLVFTYRGWSDGPGRSLQSRGLANTSGSRDAQHECLESTCDPGGGVGNHQAECCKLQLVNVNYQMRLVQNALGYIGFKVITTSGDRNEYLWTMERNLDTDSQYKAKNEIDYNN